MSELEHEKAFEEYLSRRSRMGWRADDDGLEPPAELDRIVLANAREAIRRHRSPPPYRGVRWALPVGLAATVVLSFAVLLQLGLLPRPAKDSEAPIEAHFHPDGAGSAESASDAAMASPAPPPQGVLDRPRDEAARAGARRNETPRELSPLAVEKKQAMQAQSRAERDQEVAVASSRAAAPAQGKAAPASGQLEDPAAWLRRIEALRAQGKTAQADREWQAFRKAWPDYPVKEAPPP
jgi:hypothetical protein